MHQIDREILEQVCDELKRYWDNPVVNKEEIERLFSERLDRIKLPQKKLVNMPSHKEGYLMVYKIAWDDVRNVVHNVRDDICNTVRNIVIRNAICNTVCNAVVDFNVVCNAIRNAVWDDICNAIRNKIIWNASPDIVWDIVQEITCIVTNKNIDFFKGYIELYKNGLFSYWVLPDKIVYVCNPKISLKNGVLHNETKEAVLWENGEKYYFLNGVHVDKDIVLTPAEKLDPQLLIKETNAEVRREIIRKIGIDRILQKLQGKLLDTWREYELYRIENIDIEPVHVLKMRCPSKGLFYSLRVPPEITKAYEARVWISNGKKPEEFLCET
ncbi:MAG TPA: hypothetical protein ENN27_01310 [Candidatus Atribacteria bacterium]|nr:hypothetical protein [Candidatus Atribacteria bacterium]